MKLKILSIQVLIAFGLLGVQKTYAQQDYEGALNAGIQFFDANKCGPEAGEDNINSWRGACHTGDGELAGLDLTGGYHDAGDHVKFGLPQTWSAATLGFSLYEFREAFDNAGATSDMLSTLKYFTDYFLKCHTNANTFYYHVGDGNVDHGYWGSPELQTGDRALIAATPSTPASDVCGEAAAALSLMYLNYKNVNSTYATQCLTAAKEIFSLGKNYLGRSSDGGGGAFYKSSSHFDDLSWGAIWLTIATGDQSYLDDVYTWIETPNDYGDDPFDKHWAPAWDDVTVFAMIKLYELTGEQKYYDGVINNLEWYRDECTRTPGGLPWLDSWGVLRYASAEAAVGYLMAQKFDYAGYMETADLTMNYILGDNPRNSSYITNWGNNAPQHPHHRANEPNRDGVTNGMVGALVGGPNSGDGYTDDVNDYTLNEVAIDYNASFILGMAGKVYFEYNNPPVPNVPPTVSLTSPSSGASFDQGETVTMTASASDSDGSIEKVEFLVNGSKIGEDASAPYSYVWTIPLAGSYTLSARAIDDRNASTISSTVTINAVSNFPDPTTPNLALNKTATASSLENGGFTAGAAVDGDYSSRWASLFADPQWVQVDLGAEYTINRAIISWEAAAGKVYDIQVSDNGTTWTTAAAISGGNGGEDDIVFNDVSARYIRMYGTERTTDYGYSIFEFEVYGPEEGSNLYPTARISVNPTSGTTPLNVDFNGNASTDSDGTIESYVWDFGDGSTGTGAAVSHIYTTNGTYTATLTVTDNEGASDDAIVSIICVPEEVEVTEVIIDESEISIDMAESVTYQLTATVLPIGATNQNIFWTTSDASVATVSSTGLITAVYDGTAIITATTEENNFEATCIVTVSGYVEINYAPKAVITSDITSGIPGTTVNFSAEGSTDVNDDVLTYTWSFGDGASATGVNVSNTYDEVGSYSATVVVSDGELSDEASLTITIADEPVVCEDPIIVSVPFAQDGEGTSLCFFTSDDIAYVNSWCTESVTINNVDYTNTWSNSLPDKINGGYYIAYSSLYAWAHLEVAALKSANKLESLTGLNVYPNPFNQSATLTLEKPDMVNSIEILDQTGKVVELISSSDISHEVTFGENLNAGLYIIKINSSNTISTLMISKK